MSAVARRPLGPLQANCYLYYCTRTRQACLVDPGAASGELAAEVRRLGLTLAKILCTHAHFDHVFGAGAFKREFPGAAVLCHESDVVTWAMNRRFAPSFGLQCPGDFPDAPDGIFRAGDEIPLGELTITVLHTPGHTPGSVCLLDRANKVCFTGDTLFQNSIGRTDFPGGSKEQMKSSLHYLRDNVDADVTIHPGHMGPAKISTALRYALIMIDV